MVRFEPGTSGWNWNTLKVLENDEKLYEIPSIWQKWKNSFEIILKLTENGPKIRNIEVGVQNLNGY